MVSATGGGARRGRAPRAAERSASRASWPATRSGASRLSSSISDIALLPADEDALQPQVGVEDQNVGPRPRFQPPAVREPDMLRGDGRGPPHRLLERQAKPDQV